MFIYLANDSTFDKTSFAGKSFKETHFSSPRSKI